MIVLMLMWLALALVSLLFWLPLVLPSVAKQLVLRWWALAKDAPW